MAVPTASASRGTTLRAILHRATLAAMSVGVLAGMGCSRLRNALGTDSEYLFIGQDVISVPGQKLRVAARLQKVNLPHEVKKATIGFYLDSKWLAEAITDEEGTAGVSFMPPRVGDYVFDARYTSNSPSASAAQTQVLVAVRHPDVPLCVVDLDKTLVDAGYRTVLTGAPPPMEHAAPVMERIARDHLVIYLTSRPEQLGLKTKNWLRVNGFPRGPVFLTEVEELLGGNRKYKSRTLARMRSSFKGTGVGIGNVKSDMLAYLDNDLRAIYLVHLSRGAKPNPHDLRDKIHDLRELPPSVQVAMNWHDVESALFENTPLTIDRACGFLEHMAGK